MKNGLKGVKLHLFGLKIVRSYSVSEKEDKILYVWHCFK